MNLQAFSQQTQARGEGRAKVSVVVPVKNGERTISDCLQAVFSQSLKPFEVIIVDGQSTDKTLERAERFPVKVIFETHGTVGGARQEGVENAEGDYIAFTDADCIPESNWLENLMEAMDSQEVVGAGGGILNTGEGIFEKSIALVMNTFLGSGNSVQGRLFKEKRFVKSISGCNSLYRKETLMKIGGYNVLLSINEETELNNRLTKLGKLIYTPDAVITHDQGRGLRDFSKRTFEFGESRGKLGLWDLPCIPPIASLVALISLLFSPWPFVGMTAVYFAVVSLTGAKFAIQKKDVRCFVSIPAVYAIEHVSYSFGYLKGLLRI